MGQEVLRVGRRKVGIVVRGQRLLEHVRHRGRLRERHDHLRLRHVLGPEYRPRRPEEENRDLR